MIPLLNVWVVSSVSPLYIASLGTTLYSLPPSHPPWSFLAGFFGKCSQKRNEAYKELGKALYNAEKEGSDDAEVIKNIIVDIDALYEKLAEQENQVAQLKKQKKCISCGQMCDDEAEFCSKCGSKLE